MALVGSLLIWALGAYSTVLVARIVLDWVRAFLPSWRPRGAVFIAAGIVYALTDWLLLRVRKVIPPLRLGGIALDISVFILFILIGMLQNLISLFLV